jgi:regulatory protein
MRNFPGRREAGAGAVGPPTEASLHEAALAYLSRYAASRARLVAVLDRQCERWAERAGGETAAARLADLRRLVRGVVERLVAAGIVDDAAFAASRARSLARSGRSRRAVAAHLAARGIADGDAAEALPDDPEVELAAALVLTRRRRIGLFRPPGAAADPVRELGVLARAGFSREAATRALGTAPATAEALLARLRRR